MTSDLQTLLDQNKAWAEKIEHEHPGFFKQLEDGQKPDYLWIGCSDSRVPASQIVDLMPGELFVHRNVGNIVSHDDINAKSVIQFAVDVLKVKHIIVCGHYGCGAVHASLFGETEDPIDQWLGNIRNVYQKHKEEIDGIKSEKAKASRLCELNVFAQVQNLKELDTIKNALDRGQELNIHGWIYDISNGLLKDLNAS